MKSSAAEFARQRSGVLLAATILTALFMIGEALDRPVADIWAMLGVEHEGIAFLDLAMITGASDCVARGLDPYVTASCDPTRRIYNYPPIMLLLSHLGLRNSHTVPLGLALDVAFFAALICVMKARTGLGQSIIFLAVVSYPVLWGLERGNVDLAIFVGCVAACALLRDGSLMGLRFAAAGGILLVLFLAKLYPIAASTALWRDRRTLYAALILAMGALLAYFVSDPAMFAAVRKLTPSMTERSYGAGVLTGHLFLRTSEAHAEYGVVTRPAQLAAYVLSALGLLGAAFIAFRRAERVTAPFDLRPSLALRLALTGASIYCLTYCLGTNFSYRLIFLTLPVPYFISGWEERRHRGSLLLAVATVTLLLAKWQTHYGFDYRRDELLPILAEILGFALFVAYATGIFSFGLTLAKRRKCPMRTADSGADARTN